MSEPEVDGRINLHIDVCITSAEMKAWGADRIAQFFNGLAMIQRSWPIKVVVTPPGPLPAAPPAEPAIAERVLPLGHEFDVFGDGQDSCGITYCGQPASAHIAPENEEPKP